MPKVGSSSAEKVQNASIVIATLNNKETLRRVLNAMMKLRFQGRYEIIVVNDGSSDGTKEMLEKEYSKKVKVIHLPRSGVCKARNTGIEAAQYEVVVNMDHDCIPEKDWLSKMVRGFDSDKIGIVSAYDYYGGTSTGFRKELLDRVGGYDEDYFYYREDTDLSFKIMDLGYEFKLVEAGYEHCHEMVKPKRFWELAKHVLQRLKYHQNDVLLWKKHPTKVCADFLHVKWGFMVDPWADFAAATGLWKTGNRQKGKLELSSPRGITFLQNKSPIHALVIVIVGIGYVFAVKCSRLIGSIRFGKLLL